MKKLISSLKRIRIGQILTVCLASLLIFVSTACGSGGGLQARAQTADQVKEEVPEGTAASPYKGGMNEFPDTDPRRDISEADAKAESLVQKAERNITEKSIDSPEEFVENFQQGTPLGKRVQNFTEDVSKGTQRGLEDIKGNAQGVAKGAQRAAEDTSDFAKRKTGEAAKGVQRAAEDVPGQVSGG